MKLRVLILAALAPSMALGRAHADTTSDDIVLVSNYDEVNTYNPPVVSTAYADPNAPEPQAAGDQPCNCGQCASCCDPRGRSGLFGRRNGLLEQIRGYGRPVSERYPRVGLYVFQDYDSWRGYSDGVYQNNNGGAGGLNIGFPVIEPNGYDIHGQVGMSYGLYDWNGRGSPLATNQNLQQQMFFTYGLYHRADANRPFSWAVVQDWMVNNNFGQYAQSFSLSQWRGQVGWALSDKNEVGLWGALRDRGYSKTLALGAPLGTGTNYWRPINQLNAFWHRKFIRCGADAWFTIGYAESYRLNQSPGYGGSLGGAIFGTMVNVPVNDRLAIYANWQYMAPTATVRSVAASGDETFNLMFGFAVYPGGTARSSTVAGRKNMPLMNVANNGTFFVDTNR
ncbi:MAG TPA: DUF6666 family protein [Pirellulales bacterium]|nr:DUF6666 family protein [Pirellulales bacterium]